MSRKYTKTEKRVFAGIMVSPLIIGGASYDPMALGLVFIIACFFTGISVFISTLRY